jgi:hypothetical protein
LKLLCAYGAGDELSGRRHRDLFYIRHRDGPLALPRVALMTLVSAGIRTLRTDSNRAIHILTDGKILQVARFVGCADITAQLNSAPPQTPQDQQSNQQQ